MPTLQGRAAHRPTPGAQGIALLATLSLAAGLASFSPLAGAAPPLPQLTLATHYHAQVDVTRYWVSEKYDGIRAYWDGAQLWTRQGQPIAAPAWFTQHWPTQAMEGELWAGRGQFAQVQSTVAHTPAHDAGWRQLRWMLFDAPQQAGGFSQRLQWLQRTAAALRQPWVQAAPQWRVASHTELMRQLHALEAAGAEGLMLRHEDAPYRGGRSSDLLKLKSRHDAEALVVGHIAGQGKYHGMLGAVLVQMPSGQRFRIGTGFTDAERRQPPPLGSTVTYSYQGLHASGLPRFARFVRIRTDGSPP